MCRRAPRANRARNATKRAICAELPIVMPTERSSLFFIAPENAAVISTVAHELRSPLMTLSASIEVLASRREGLPKSLLEAAACGRAIVATGSLLTGQLYVSFDFYPGAPKAKVDLRQQEPELPVVPSTLVELEDKVTHIVDKIEKMPLEAIGNDLKKDLENLDQTLTGARKLLSDADVQLVPALKTSLEDLHRTLVAVDALPRMRPNTRCTAIIHGPLVGMPSVSKRSAHARSAVDGALGNAGIYNQAATACRSRCR